MAKKQGINQSGEIRAIAEQLGKDAKFKDVFEKLQAQHKGHKFNENSCQQAFTLARKKLRFAKGRGGRKKNAAKPEPVMAARVVPAGRPTARARGGAGTVVEAMTTAQKLIAVCGGKDPAKHVIDNVTA